jgi:hypothetical protein
MAWYIELHCDKGLECPYGHGEQGPQGASVKNVSADARRQGWSQIGGRWLCPGCVEDAREGKQ